MRRADREIGDVTQKMEVLRRCKVVHLAMVDGQGLYSLPLSFGFQVEGEELTLYLHSAKEGRKVNILRAGCQVGFSMVEGKTPCSYSCHYESLVGSGWAEEVTDAEEKCRALGAILRHQAGVDADFTEAMAESVAVFRIRVTELTGKARR
mgnify:CR=1 FL=1